MTAQAKPKETPFTPEWSAPNPRLLRAELPPAPSLPLRDVLEPRLSKWVQDAAEAKGAPADYVFAALLTVAGSTIGNARWASIWQGWSEPPVIWSMCIGLPSAGKSPAIDAALQPLRKAERPMREAAEAQRTAWAEKTELAKLAEATWKDSARAAIKDGKAPPEKPPGCDAGPPPHMPRPVVNDGTIERLGAILAHQPRGTLQMRDELAGWLEGMQRYSGGGSDRPFWLEAYGGRGFTVERVGREPLTIDRLSIGVLGGIQPDRLKSLLFKSDDDGLLARFLPIWPEPAPLQRPQAWADETLMDAALGRLLSLDLVTEEAGQSRPWLVPFTEEACALMQDFRAEVRGWEAGAEGLILSFVGKLPGLAARLALVLAYLDWAADGADQPHAITVGHFGRAAHLVEAYLLPMARRAYSDAATPKAERAARRLVGIIREQGWQRFTSRDVLRLDRSGLATAAELNPALALLEEGECIRLVDPPSSPQGGRPQRLDAYLDALKQEKLKANEVDELIAAKPHLGLSPLDYPKAAWDELKAAGRLPASRAGIPFSPRQDGIGRPVPNVTLKVPTGGGKTWLAVNSVSRIIGRYLGTNTGFVLWIVPNEAIYSQTLKRLKDRQHPYRQALDRAAAGRVKIMEKEDRLHAADVKTHLSVMVLMLQAANRQTQATLKMFQDRGDVHGFFPAEGEQQLHEAMLKAVPNLDGYQGMFPMVKDSLGNALRLIRPIVVMDEGQKATSDLAFKTLYGFNPAFVLELTATPKEVKATATTPARIPNLLVEVLGQELHAEDMIKMPLNLDPRQGTDWRATMNAALGKLKELDLAAEKYRGETGRYIRPIMLVQVERTGKDQRDGAHIHADDVREWLLQAGFDGAEVAIKTAEQNDLSQPENLDLLSDKNRVRVIITKAALQEGWDCPFAYVLCSLAANSNLSAMTQLVGRILRQPYAVKTKVPELDECHVITHHAGSAEVVRAIKDGLEKDGLSDLVLSVAGGGEPGGPAVSRKVERRAEFKSVEIYLPRVLRRDGGKMRDLDYETDLLAAIDWRGYDPTGVVQAIPENAQEAVSQLQVISLASDGHGIEVGKPVAFTGEAMRFDPAYAARAISDLVPNPFVAREIVGRLLTGLAGRGFEPEEIGRLGSLILNELRKELDLERNARAEALFRAEVLAGRIQFRLRLDGANWRMPNTVETSLPLGARVLAGQDGTPVRKSMFSPFYEADLNAEERGVAVMLDGDGAIQWWHRNVALSGYGVQGWKRGRIYPDFIFAAGGTGTARRIVALETKGDHLQNPDTDYKRELLNFLSTSFAWDTAVPAGQLQLQQTGETVECTLILMQDIPTKLPTILAKGA